MITQEELKRLFRYESETGNFIRLVKTNRRMVIGSIAGHADKFGYVRIKIGNNLYLLHRLAWLYVYGKFPDMIIDHIDGNPNNNKLINLREASLEENSRNSNIKSNNKCGYRGVVYKESTGMWQAQCGMGGVSTYLGNYLTPQEASIVYESHVKSKYGEFYKDIYSNRIELV
jgi:hypothetical protein